MEALGQTKQPAATHPEGSASPSPSLLTEEIAPLEVIQKFVDAMNSGSVLRELANEFILSYYGRLSRGATVAANYLRTLVSSRYRHEAFEEAANVSAAQAEILKVRFKRSFAWLRRRMAAEQKVCERPATLHLRAESDDDEEEEQQQPSRCPTQLVTPPRPASHDQDQLTFVEASGVLKSLAADLSDDAYDSDNSRMVHITLGYRQVPLVFGHGRDIEICLAMYEKHSVASPSGPIPRRGSAARCNSPTDDEAEEDSHTKRGVRRTLFAGGNEEEPEASQAAEKQRDKHGPQQEQQPALERVQEGVETITQVERAQSSATATAEVPLASAISIYTPRKRHSNASVCGEVEPKRTPGRNRLRF